MLKIIVIISVSLLMLCATVSAIGGGRSGITIGGSLGFAPVMAWDRTVDGNGGPATGWTSSIMLGYGIDSKNTLVFEGTTAHTSGSSTLLMNFTGIRWYAFARPTAPSGYFACGLGWSSLFGRSDAAVFNVMVGNKLNFPAATVAFGYEPVRWQLVGLYINAGRQEDFTLINLSIMFTIMAY